MKIKIILHKNNFHVIIKINDVWTYTVWVDKWNIVQIHKTTYGKVNIKRKQ